MNAAFRLKPGPPGLTRLNLPARAGKYVSAARLGALRCHGSAARDVSLCAVTLKVFCRSAAQRCTRPGPIVGCFSNSAASACKKAWRWSGWIGAATRLHGGIFGIVQG